MMVSESPGGEGKERGRGAQGERGRRAQGERGRRVEGEGKGEGEDIGKGTQTTQSLYTLRCCYMANMSPLIKNRGGLSPR